MLPTMLCNLPICTRDPHMAVCSVVVHLVAITTTGITFRLRFGTGKKVQLEYPMKDPLCSLDFSAGVRFAKLVVFQTKNNKFIKHKQASYKPCFLNHELVASLSLRCGDKGLARAKPKRPKESPREACVASEPCRVCPYQTLMIVNYKL